MRKQNMEKNLIGHNRAEPVISQSDKTVNENRQNKEKNIKRRHRKKVGKIGKAVIVTASVHQKKDKVENRQQRQKKSRRKNDFQQSVAHSECHTSLL